MRLSTLLSAAVVCTAVPAVAQQPTRADSTRDSTSAQALQVVRVAVTRSAQTAQTTPWAVGVQTKKDLAGTRGTLGIDEALPEIPGVYVANRYNYALDQRLSIRGAGARANFGLRGVKVLLDGVPQSLPDGQSQLTNIDLADISRVEVLRGSASSLYGNGSGGVLAFTTDLSAPDRLGETVRLTSGSFGLRKWQSRTAGRFGRGVGSLSISRTTVDGFRQYSAADTRQLLGAWDYAASDATSFALRVSAAETPKALNPGALTPAEYAANPDSAAAVNIARGASREVSQQQVSLRARHTSDAWGEWALVGFVQRRFVDNALATAPPAPAGSANGTYATLNRWVTGARLDGSRALCACRGAPTLSLGLDLNRSADIRRNRRSTAGRPRAAVDTLLLWQDEIVASVGASAAVQWTPLPALTLSAGGRYDRLAFDVKDHFFGDGANNTGSRTMAAATGHLGASYVVGDAFTPYLNVSTAFETPTTTELQVRPDGQGGFNPDLGPQKIRTYEVGARGTLGTDVRYTVSWFEASADAAIIQYLETNGRAFFRNAGRTRNRGVELGATVRATPWLDLTAAYTLADYRFTSYRVPRGAVTDTLDGKVQAGVPEHVVRIGARTHVGAFTFDADHANSSSMWADDRNTVRVADWRGGVYNARLGWSGAWGAIRLQPFAAINNLTDVRYVGAVTLNGAGARDLEPAPGRNYYFGMELGWRVVR
jgi:iron complex outermembrane receptor protein